MHLDICLCFFCHFPPGSKKEPGLYSPLTLEELLAGIGSHLAFVFQNTELLEDSHKGGRERGAGCERGDVPAGLSGAGAHTHFSEAPREMAGLGGEWLSARKEAGLCLHNAQAQTTGQLAVTTCRPVGAAMTGWARSHYPLLPAIWGPREGEVLPHFLKCLSLNVPASWQG